MGPPDALRSRNEPPLPHRRRSVLLVFPRLRYVTGDPPLGLALLAAVLRRERPLLDVKLLDATFLRDRSTLLDSVRTSGADVVGVFVDALMAADACMVAQVARAAGARTLAGGPQATVAAASLLPHFDCVLQGEGELRIAPVIDRLLERASLDDIPGLLLPGPGPAGHATAGEIAYPDLDALPFPAWDLLDMPRYLRLWPYLDSVRMDATGTNVIGSRGCPWQCTYCQPTLSALFGRKIRRRSPELVVEEIAELQRRYGIDGVFFHADTLTAQRKWMESLCDSLRRLPKPVLWGCNSRVDIFADDLVETMVSAGMRSVHLGIEAGSERVRKDVLGKAVDVQRLQQLVRKLNDNGAHALGFFMLGTPTETLPEMLQTIALARRLPLAEATFSITSLLPGTQLHDAVAPDPRFVLHDHGVVDYYQGRNFEDRQSAMGPRALHALQLAALGAFYLHPLRIPYLVRHLGSRGGVAKLGMKLSRFLGARQ